MFDSYNRWCDEAAATVRAHIRAEGYKPKELATRLPSVRAGRLTDFMKGKGEFAPRVIASYAEAAGLELDPPNFRKRTSWAPRIQKDEPRQDGG
ncbi:hypothetical protein FV226_13225 [Methylobacterium sp. WL12]|uniref:hypothetical protein n=1 Tax=Methylobacterium sp. WL12 TaxID=2603890 RepID=UPI0011C8AADC|nr:hypothetical protein [Methylobacterium sp. WL12]TXM72185.1 hypothetical protein FV226_13225 [Methylobacterium sp. WL12]